jgi:nitrogen regulatory protein PII
MKMVMIVYNEAIDEEVMGSLLACCIGGFTKWQRVLGQGKISEPHLDSSVWPGTNNVCMAVVENEKVKPLLEQVKGLRKQLGKEGIKAFVLPVEEVTE